MSFDNSSSDAARPYRGWRFLPWLVLALVAAMTVSLALWSARVHSAEERALLERRAEAFGLALSGRVQAYIDTLPGLRQFGVLRKTPNDLEFLQYVQAISLQRRFPGLALTFFAERVKSVDVASYVDAVRNDRTVAPDGHPGFAIQPAGERAQYMVLRHVHPVDPVSFGYDLYDPAQSYRAPVDRAIATGSNVATVPLLLARDRYTTGRPELTSVVVRMPLYVGGVTPDSVAARVEQAAGVVGISFHVSELVGSVWPPELTGQVHIGIADIRARQDGQNALVYDSDWAHPRPASPSVVGVPVMRCIDVADRTWEISVAPIMAATAWTLDHDTWVILFAGGLLAVSLAVMTHTLLIANRRSEARVQSATAQLLSEGLSLEKSESRYRMLFENSQEAMLRTRPEGAILAANEAAIRLFGWSEQQMRERGRAGLVDESDTRLGELLQARADTGHTQGLLRMFKADGSTFEADITSSVYIDSQGQSVTRLMVRDVTERERAHDRQTMLTDILDSTPDFVGSAGVDGHNMFLNLAWRRQLGLGKTEDVSSLRIEDCHPPWAIAIVLQQGIPEARRNGVWSGQTAILANDGREIPVSQVILCHRDAKGNVTHFSTVARDLTELKRAETERQALEAQLRESQKMESVGTLAGGVAHDFNNVLVAILGNSALATEALAAAHPAQQNLARIKQAATRARTLVQQILTFSRRTAQQSTVQALGPLVEEGLSLLRSTLPPTVSLTSAIPAEPLFVLVDAAQMQQVVLNLCTNAWQSLPEGRGSIEVSLAGIAFEPGDEVPSRLRPGRYARVRVRDDGCGMDAATRQRVFEPFFTTKRVGEGTGLGLAVVHGIVAAAAGAIKIESAPGEGSSFDVYLPCQERPVVDAMAESDRLDDQRGDGERILYVDDDEVVGLTMRALLERAGYVVTLRANGTDALHELEADPKAFALVITDFNMPDMSGLVVAERVRELDARVPVVITSGYVTDELQDQAKNAGVRAVLLKEYSLERLGALVHDILKGD